MSPPDNEFEKAAQQKQPGLVAEFIGFLKQNRKFWLLPLFILLLLLTALVVLSSTAAAPFIYTFF